MLDLTSKILTVLDHHRLAGLELGSQNLFPHYGGYSLANLPATVFHRLGLDAPVTAAPPMSDDLFGPHKGRFRRVVLGVIDGLGLEQFQSALSDAETGLSAVFGEDAVLAPLTSIVPSTTSTALTTLWTGAYPAEHAVVGYEMYLKEYGLTANMLLHAPATYQGDVGSLSRAGFRPETFLPVPVIGPHLAAQGVRTTVMQHHSIARSGLSSMLFKDTEVLPVWGLSDMFVTLEERLAEGGNSQEYLYFYWGELDDLMHRYAPGDERVRLGLSGLSAFIGRFLRRAKVWGKGDTLFLLTADHGHLATPLSAVCDLRTRPELLDCLSMLPAGESRLAYAFLRPGREERFLEGLEKHWAGQVRAFQAQQFLEMGMFGPRGMDARLPDRVGDLILSAQLDSSIWWANKENVLRGRHGGLSRTEMLVPLVSMVI